MVNSRVKSTSLLLVRIALMSALLTSAKFALSFVPNVEIVTILIIVISSSFGLKYSLPSVLVFCAMEIVLYGFNSWVLLYFIFWPMLSIISSFLLKRKSILIAIIISIVGSISFGLLSAACDTLFCVFELSSADLTKYFVAYYLRGVSFDIVHLVSNAILTFVLYLPLIKVSQKIMPYDYNCNKNNFKKLFKISNEYMREDK